MLCNQALIEILHRSGKVRRYNEITGESAPAPPMGRIILKAVPPEQVSYFTIYIVLLVYMYSSCMSYKKLSNL